MLPMSSYLDLTTFLTLTIQLVIRTGHFFNATIFLTVNTNKKAVEIAFRLSSTAFVFTVKRYALD